MALLDLSLVTRSFVTLIREAFVISPAWPIAPPAVLPEPPARITGEGLGFYLYHVLENKTYSNFPTPGNDQPPVRFLPMALSLYYQLSANSILEDGTGAYNEQIMMGIAMKVLHDYPQISDSTQINGTTVFPPLMRGKDNRIKVMFLPIPYNEAVNNWTAGAAPIRLSAYYEVSVVFFEPDQSLSYSGRVLTYGNFIFTEGAPQIISTQNIISYTVPNETTPAQVKLHPAQAPPGNVVDLFGTGLGGDQVDLMILNPRWSEPAIADASWGLNRPAQNQLSFTIKGKATLKDSGTVVDIIPGMYNVQIAVTKNIHLSGSDIRKIRNVSNQFPLIISPGISNINYPPGNFITVKGYIFQHPDLSPDRIEIYLGENRILLNTGGPFNAGEFQITAVDTLLIQLPAGLNPGDVLPLRILILGAESTPNWVTIH